MSDIIFPDPNEADDEGLVAVGGELSSDFLLEAYKQGLFPWFNEGEPILWWSPNPRMVLFPEKFNVHPSLRQTINSGKFTIKIDTQFIDVIENCANVKRNGQQGTWIGSGMVKAYTQLHLEGWAHSFETFFENELVGGLYGLSIGKVFFGESMFHLQSDASKFALYNLIGFCKRNKFHFIDVQQSTAHLKSLGAQNVPRNDFMNLLKSALLENSIRGKWNVMH